MTASNKLNQLRASLEPIGAGVISDEHSPDELVGAAMLSAAVSLKRIADAAERMMPDVVVSVDPAGSYTIVKSE